jgi:hypothetical protein
LVATASWDNTARIWDAESGQAIGPAIRHEGWVTHVAFSPDSKWLVTASRDGTARLVSVAPVRGDADELLMISELLAAERVGPHGGTVPLSRSEMEVRWKALRGRTPASQ